MSEPVTIESFARALRGRRISAAELVDDLLHRIAEDNPRLNAFILVTADLARQQAREADRELQLGRDRGPLHGVPISIKDLFDMTGTPTTGASRVREGHVAAADALAVARLREAGAIIVGKTNLHEFAFGTTNEDSAYGPARNPHDPTRSPGGSSGGSAASVAGGMALASLGSDTGGSIRIPAAACGIVGLKPTFGEVSLDGAIPLSRALDHAGPLALSVADAALMFGALCGRSDIKANAARPDADLRFAVLRDYFCDLLDDDVRARFEEALAAIRSAGATVVERRIDHVLLTPPAYMHITFGDAAAYHARTIEAVPHLYTPAVRQRIELARYVMAEDYVRALEIRDVLRAEVDAALDEGTTLLLPTLPIPAPIIGAATVDIRGESQSVRSLMLRDTQLFNLTGHPAISIPCGRTSTGLPCGLQLVGSRGATEDLLATAAAVEGLLS